MIHCNACILRKGCRAPVPPDGPLNADVVIVGEAPGESEDRVGRSFVGKSGQELDQALKRAGIHRLICRVMNLVLCRPKDNRDPLPEEIKTCSTHLFAELAKVRPRLVITVGVLASQAFLGQNFSLLRDHGIPRDFSKNGLTFTVLPTYHPAAALRLTSLMKFINADLETAKKILQGYFSARLAH